MKNRQSSDSSGLAPIVCAGCLGMFESVKRFSGGHYGGRLGAALTGNLNRKAEQYK